MKDLPSNETKKKDTYSRIRKQESDRSLLIRL